MATPTTLPASFTAGNVLTALQMNNLRGAFRILQVVQDTTTSPQSTTSATYADTDLSLSITPQSSSSKILAVFSGISFATQGSTEGAFKIVRSSTDIAEILGLSYSSAGAAIGTPIIIYLDSPATASAVTYKIQYKRIAGAGAFVLAQNGSFCSLTLLEVSA
jgi:hypothetical protein